jgi:hypothetical protein
MTKPAPCAVDADRGCDDDVTGLLRIFVCLQRFSSFTGTVLSFATVERLPFRHANGWGGYGFQQAVEISTGVKLHSSFMRFSCDAVVTRGWVTRRRCHNISITADREVIWTSDL